MDSISRLTHIDPRDVAKVFAILYCFFGLIGFLLGVIQGMDAVRIPVGFNIGVCSLVLNWDFNNLHRDFFVFAFVALLYAMGAAISGAVTGGILAMGFNLIGKRTGFVVRVNAKELHEPAPVPFDI